MASWMFPSYTVTLTQSDPEQFFFLSPLIKHAKPDPRDPTDPYARVLTERSPIIGPFDVNTTIRGRISLQSDGITGEADAGLGTRVVSRLTVQGRGDHCEIRNECTVEGFVLMVTYITQAMTRTQEAVLAQVAQRAEQE